MPDKKETSIDSGEFADNFFDAFFSLGGDAATPVTSDTSDGSGGFMDDFVDALFSLGKVEHPVVALVKASSGDPEVLLYPPDDVPLSGGDGDDGIDLATWDPEDLGDGDAIL